MCVYIYIYIYVKIKSCNAGKSFVQDHFRYKAYQL